MDRQLLRRQAWILTLMISAFLAGECALMVLDWVVGRQTSAATAAEPQ